MEKQKKSVLKKWWFWLIILCVIAATLGIVFGDPNANTIGSNTVGSNTTTQTTNERFSLIDSEGSFDGVAYYVTGTIKNNTNKQYAYVQVTFNLYDDDGAQIGTAMANINNLEANGTWKFKALGITENVASYKLMDITGW